MQATRILAVRHGETQWNAFRRVQGHLDIPLNAHGHWQAGRVADAIAQTGENPGQGQQMDCVAAVYSSDLQRAMSTAQPIAHAAQAPFFVETALRERHLGVFQGKAFDELKALYPQEVERWRKREPEFRVAQGGESLADLQVRIQAIVAELASRHIGEQIVLVSHGGVLDILYRLATGQGLQAPRTWLLENAAINRLLWNPSSGLALIGWGDTQHLSEGARDEMFH